MPGKWTDSHSPQPVSAYPLAVTCDCTERYDVADAAAAAAPLPSQKRAPDASLADRLATLDARRLAYVLYHLTLAEQHQRVADETRVRMDSGLTLAEALAVMEDRTHYSERQIRRIVYGH